ncbi:HNH endonuclease [Escherichia coli]
MKTKNQIKAEYILSHWQLRDGVVYSKITNKPVAFATKDKDGRHNQTIRINGKEYKAFIHEAVFILFHRRAIDEGMVIHHVDHDFTNNAINNLVELTPRQHSRIHAFACNDPLRGICLRCGAWVFRWYDDNGVKHVRHFHGIDDAMNFRAEIEAPRRAELRALGLNCKRSGNHITRNTLRQISRPARVGLWRYR